MADGIKTSDGLSYYFEKEYEGISEIDNPTLIYIDGVGDCTDEHVQIGNYFVFATPTVISLASEKMTRLSLGNQVEIYSTALRRCPNLREIRLVGEGYCARRVIDNCIVRDKTVVCMCPNSVIPRDGSVNRLGLRVLSAYGERTEIAIPEGIEVLGEEVCYGCERLERLLLPKSLKRVGKDAFSACVSLKEIHFAGTAEEWERVKAESEGLTALDGRVRVIFGG